MVLPEYRAVVSSLVSIQATPTTRLVCTASGRTQVSYTAGRPSTVRPAGCQTPSPASSCPAGDVIRRGAGRCAVAASAGPPAAGPRRGMADGAGVPPTGGG